MATPKKIPLLSEIDDDNFVLAVNDWIDAKLSVLKQEQVLEGLKNNLKDREFDMTEQMTHNGIKSVRSDDGLLTLANAVFGSIKKDIDKDSVTPIVEQYEEFVHSIKYEPTLNSKILGAAIKQLRDNAFDVWKAQQAAGIEVEPFNASMYLPDDLIDVLNVSEEFTVRFTPSRESSESDDSKD